MLLDNLFSREINKTVKLSTSRFDIGLLKENDLQCFSQRGEFLLSTLRDADLCFVAREKRKAIHHTCVSLKSFIRPGGYEKIFVGNKEAYIYQVFTNGTYRGHGIAVDVLNYINKYLSRLSIRKILTYVANDNVGSKKLFHKAGYLLYGRQYLINLGRKNIWFVLSNRRCFAKPCIFRVPFIQVYHAILPDMKRINIEIKPFVQQWKKNNLSVALFGGGAHSRLLVENCISLRNMISYVFDNDPKKQGRYFDPLRLIIDNSGHIKQINPDVIIVSSKIFQEEIILQLFNKSSVNAHIVRCYPIVEYVSKSS